MTNLGAQSALGIVAGLFLVSGCASLGSCEVQALDGFYASCAGGTLKERNRLDLVLPISEQEFLAEVSGQELEINVRRPGDYIPPPKFSGVNRDEVSHVIFLSRVYPLRHELYYAYVIDGQVVAVENRSQEIFPIG